MASILSESDGAEFVFPGFAPGLRPRWFSSAGSMALATGELSKKTETHG
jgi:hypothetical protein